MAIMKNFGPEPSDVANWQYDLLADLIEPEMCSSAYGLCE
jgi:hypothetical protein